MLFFSEMYDYRARLQTLQDLMPVRRFEATILHALPPKYDFVWTYRDRTMGISETRSTWCDAYINELARFADTPAVSGHGATMQADASRTKPFGCPQQRHRMRVCPNKQLGPSLWKNAKRRKSAAGKSGNGQCEWCSYQRSTTHSGKTCVTHHPKTAEAAGSMNFGDICTSDTTPEPAPCGFFVSTIGVLLPPVLEKPAEIIFSFGGPTLPDLLCIGLSEDTLGLFGAFGQGCGSTLGTITALATRLPLPATSSPGYSTVVRRGST